MKILFIGYSNVFKQRIIPILNEISEFTEIHIAKYEKGVWDNQYKKIKTKVKLYDNYDDAFKYSNADIAYISTVNSAHFSLAFIALNANMHTIVDKPIVLKKYELNVLLALSKITDKLLAESIVYTYHPKLQQLRNIFIEQNKYIKNINVIFSIPPMNPSNFRYNKKLGGGAINDMGPYAASIARYFYDEIPDKIYCTTFNKNDISVSFTLLMEFKNNKTLTGHFGFLTEYVNQISLLTNDLFVTTDRVFTIPEDKATKIIKRINNKTLIEFSEPGNSFLFFFKEIIKAIDNKKYMEFRNNIIKDNIILNMIR